MLPPYVAPRLCISADPAQKTDQSKSDILAAIPSYRAAMHKVLLSPFSDSASTLDAARVKELVKLALGAVRITTAASSPASTASLWNAAEFTALAEQYKAHDRFKGAVAIQNLLQQLVTLINGPSAKASTKRKSADEPVKAEKQAKKGKKSEKPTAPEVEVEVEEEIAAPVVATQAPGKKVKKDKKGKKSS